jgi:hypothetical protein
MHQPGSVHTPFTECGEIGLPKRKETLIDMNGRSVITSSLSSPAQSTLPISQPFWDTDVLGVLTLTRECRF